MAGKRIALTLTTALVALGVAACGGSSPPSGMPEPDDPMMGLDAWTAPGTVARFPLSTDSSRLSAPAAAPRVR